MDISTLIEPLALLIVGGATLILRQFVGVKMREADQAQLAALISRALAYGLHQVGGGNSMASVATSASNLPPAAKERMVDAAVDYARHGAPDLLKRLGSPDASALAARIKAEIAPR